MFRPPPTHNPNHLTCLIYDTNDRKAQVHYSPIGKRHILIITNDAVQLEGVKAIVNEALALDQAQADTTLIDGLNEIKETCEGLQAYEYNKAFDLIIDIVDKTLSQHSD